MLLRKILPLVTALTIISAFGHNNFTTYASGPKLVAQRVSLDGDRSFDLYLPDGFGYHSGGTGTEARALHGHES